jgi:hypothetical protein
MNYATTTLTLTALQSSRRVTGSSCPETYGVVGSVRVRRDKVLPCAQSSLSTRLRCEIGSEDVSSDCAALGATGVLSAHLLRRFAGP